MTETDPAATVRTLIRSADRATLSTVMEDGAPYSSLVMTACAMAGAPLMLLSDLAVHSRNLKADARCSLLVDGTAGLAEPLTGARATLVGTAAPVPQREDHDRLLARYVRRHPSAAHYAGFGDFRLYRMAVERAHLVAGFGKIKWVTDGLSIDPAPDLELSEPEIVSHMNADHSDAVGLYANRLLNLSGVGWRMTGIDPEGCDLRRDGTAARLPFSEPVRDPATARKELVRLAARARGEACG